METCPNCAAKEIASSTPRTVYGCGSSDYDQRPGTFERKFSVFSTTNPSTNDWRKEIKELSYQLSCDRSGDGISATYRFGKTPFAEKMIDFIESLLSRKEEEVRDGFIHGVKENWGSAERLVKYIESLEASK